METTGLFFLSIILIGLLFGLVFFIFILYAIFFEEIEKEQKKLKKNILIFFFGIGAIIPLSMLDIYFFDNYLRNILFCLLYFALLSLLYYPISFLESHHFKYSNIFINIYKAIWLIPSYLALVIIIFGVGKDYFNQFLETMGSYINESFMIVIVLTMVFFAGGHLFFIMLKFFKK